MPIRMQGQIATGTITGHVLDRSGAAIVGATISLSRADTGLNQQATTNGDGIYSFPLLQPAAYALVVEKQGFNRKSIKLTLSVGQTAGVNFTLDVGSVEQTMTVESNTIAQLESETSGIDFLVDKQVVSGLPLNGRNPYAQAQLAPGILPQGDFGTGISTVRGALATVGNNNFQTNGGIASYNEITLDGIPITVCCQGQPATTVSVETVDQFKVQTSTAPAQFGRTSGGVLDIVSKSGNNGFHGDIYDFFRNRELDAANFFTKRAGTPPIPGSTNYRLPHQFNQFGGTVSGPVIIPKLYDGKDRTFFFFGYEGARGLMGSYTTTTVPTALERQGIFTEAATPIYNPTSYSPSSGVRTLVPAATCNGTAYVAGYCIPTSTWSPVATAYLKFFPTPTNNATTNNYSYVFTQLDRDDQFNIRVDHSFSNAKHLMVRYTHDPNTDSQPDLFDKFDGLGTQIQTLAANIFTTSFTWARSASTVFNFQYGLAQQKNTKNPGNYTFYPGGATSVGFSSTLASQQQISGLPSVSVSGLASLGVTGNLAWDHYTHAVGASAIIQHGKHTLTAGFDGRMSLQMDWQLSNPTGSFSFGSTFTNGPNPNATLATGQGPFDSFASYLLGYPTSGSITRQVTFALSQLYIAGYIQDDWKITPKLTMNMGFRFDPETGYKERHNNWADFDPKASNPLSAKTGLAFMGGAQYLGADGNPGRTWQTAWANVGPRIGLAYMVSPKTVVRGGYAIYALPTSSRIYFPGTFGFQQNTSYSATVDGFTPANNVVNPFPSGVQLPQGSASGTAASAGTSISSAMIQKNPESYQQQWNFGVQRELGHGIVVSVNYAGSHGVKIPINVQPNDLNPKYFGAKGDQTQVTYLQTSVPNPFYGYITTGTLAASSVQRIQLLAAYPQYFSSTYSTTASGAITEGYVGAASSIYDALQINVAKQTHQGLTFSASYVWSKALGDATDLISGGFDEMGAPGYQNYYLRGKYERSSTTSDVPQRVVGTALYPLPFGQGKTFLKDTSGWVEQLIGKWQVSTIVSLQTGFPMTIGETGQEKFSGTRPNFVAGQNPLTSGSLHQRLNGYFNSSAFATTKSFEMGNVPRSAGNLRGPASFQNDVSLLKNFSLKEKTSLEFRLEAFNVLNKVQFGLPGTTLGSSSFGVISSQYNLPRNVQAALKLIW